MSWHSLEAYELTQQMRQQIEDEMREIRQRGERMPAALYDRLDAAILAGMPPEAAQRLTQERAAAAQQRAQQSAAAAQQREQERAAHAQMVAERRAQREEEIRMRIERNRVAAEQRQARMIMDQRRPMAIRGAIEIAADRWTEAQARVRPTVPAKPFKKETRGP